MKNWELIRLEKVERDFPIARDLATVGKMSLRQHAPNHFTLSNGKKWRIQIYPITLNIRAEKGTSFPDFDYEPSKKYWNLIDYVKEIIQKSKGKFRGEVQDYAKRKQREQRAEHEFYSALQLAKEHGMSLVKRESYRYLLSYNDWALEIFPTAQKIKPLCDTAPQHGFLLPAEWGLSDVVQAAIKKIKQAG